MSDIIFKDVSLTKRAPAWQFFHSNEDKKLAKCQLDNCSEIINWKNGLSGLSNHLRLIHKKIIKQDKSPSKTPDSKAKKSGIQQFVQTPKTPKTPKSPTNQNPGTSRMNQAAPDPNITISADPVVMKRGRVESCSIRNHLGLVIELPDPSLLEVQCFNLVRQAILSLHFKAVQ